MIIEFVDYMESGLNLKEFHLASDHCHNNTNVEFFHQKLYTNKVNLLHHQNYKLQYQ